MKVINIPDQLNEENFKTLANHLTLFMRSVGLENFNGQIIEGIEVPSGISIDIPHSLKVIPKYRIILRQIDGGTIVDGDSNWTETSVSLKNTGGTDAIISIFLIRS